MSGGNKRWRSFQNTSVLLADAEKVVRKEQQVMADSEFPEDYLLTVFPFTKDVSTAIGSLINSIK